MKTSRLIESLIIVGAIAISLTGFVSSTNAGCVSAATTGNDHIFCIGLILSIFGDENGHNPGSGDDVITNRGNVFDAIYGDSFGGAGSGEDVIINSGSVDGDIHGDSDLGTGSGNDTIINNGSAFFIFGDSKSNSGSGNDTIINNGTVNEIFGDTATGDGSGNDLIINNGTVTGNIYGDSEIGGGSGDDTIINNGIVGGDIYGDNLDGTGSGNDLIVNNGTVQGNIVAGGGDDHVVVNGVVGGTIDGGSGFDILQIGLRGCTGTFQGEIIGEIAAFADSNPSGGIIHIAGNAYTWTNFEELRGILEFVFCDGRNENADFASPTVSYCNYLGGFDVYDVNEIGVDERLTEGILTMRTDAASMQAALQTAIATGQHQLIAEDSYGNQLWALSTNEIQLMGPEVHDTSNTYVTILPASTCGIN